MKVYELMKTLSNAPASAEVIVTGWFDNDEINQSEVNAELTDEGRAIKELQFNLIDVYNPTESDEACLLLIE